MSRRLVDTREQFCFLGLGGDDPLGVNEREFRWMFGGIARKRRDEMAGFRENEQPSGRSRTVFADQTERGRAIELQLRKRPARLSDQAIQFRIRHDAPRSDQGGLGGIGGDAGEKRQGNQISFRVAGGGLRWRVAGG